MAKGKKSVFFCQNCGHEENKWLGQCPMCKELIRRVKNQMNITLTIRDSAKKYIVEKGNDQKYGARPLRRAMQTELEDKLAEAILDGEICEGMDVEVGVSKKELKFFTKDTKN